MLIYHQAFDFYHCAFRMMQVLDNLPIESYQVERLRILDFYLLFPSALNNVMFPRNALHFKKVIPDPPNPYDDIRDPYRIFTRLEPYQTGALRYLAAHGLIDSSELSSGKVRRTSLPLPEAFAAAVQAANTVAADIIALLTGPFLEIDLYGRSGLKARTHLFEFRYDPI